ncbi:hypothetical protein LY10_04235 [Planktotalea frisia]|jgi:hypothetical protein|uniref:Uncharacterized protein n=1 Tax=Planktotalea frisia TaxID=696762 RepID=A0A1L9NZX1_9RHOB|nr:hypothetical protein [Planktotalea frisia]OJI94829.1 hypothetical protein PFRI_09290 [Planktotalea frisia]PZX17997.1 hypothetical protein LY10_04235 [Planktotalea frisia]
MNSFKQSLLQLRADCHQVMGTYEKDFLMVVEVDEEVSVDDNVDDDTETSTVEFNIVVTATDWSLNQLATMFQTGD